ncbi:MAG: ROK family protein [Clostridia bacterium]|nr:ROK family protein [Clostridia bacterium]
MSFNFDVKPSIVPILDKAFRPASLQNRAFIQAVEKSGNLAPLAIALERGDGLVTTYKTVVFAEGSENFDANLFYTERLVKTLLWVVGGWKVIVGGPKGIGEYIKNIYAPGGLREFDAKFMSRVYEKSFTVEIVEYDQVPESKEGAKPVGRHLKGCRIGFDAGGSDRKVSAVIDGEAVYSEEVIWHPKVTGDPDYHYNEILTAMKTAASHMPRVDAIGVSSAGIYINNRVMVASLFIKVPEDLFDKKIKDIFLNIQKDMGGVPLEVANDGDVTALAGAMDLNDSKVLGIAMGTSEAAGYVDANGNITGWLNELAFAPVDFNIKAMVDEWSGDFGCGVKYFSQDAVIKLAPAAGIELDEKLTPAEKLKIVQNLHTQGDQRAEKIFETIGIYLGYALGHYADFYDIKHILILGRVTSGEGGNIILSKAREVLEADFPELAKQINLHLPDESNRRVGQSIAAASLPEIK